MNRAIHRLTGAAESELKGSDSVEMALVIPAVHVAVIDARAFSYHDVVGVPRYKSTDGASVFIHGDLMSEDIVFVGCYSFTVKFANTKE